MASSKVTMVAEPKPLIPDVPAGHVAVWLTGMPIDDRALLLNRASTEGVISFTAAVDGLAREVSMFHRVPETTHGLPTYRLVR